jgi:hypothetical protein
MATEPDGTLLQWDQVADLCKCKWETLLVGNGLSINVWDDFNYAKLYDHAKSQRDLLTSEDRRLFKATPNFERVLGSLLTAIRINETYGLNAAPLYEAYRRIQLALGHAVREVHAERVPDDKLSTIRSTLEDFEWIFTTSYDLLLYWAIASGGKFDPFVDHFWLNGRCEFDPDQAEDWRGKVSIYFLHGALHLVVSGSGVTRKLRRGERRNLLSQFGEPIPGDPQARPLLVTEGSADDKLLAIESNPYLGHALQKLRENVQPTVVFGASLGASDEHLVKALTENPKRPVAVSMLPERKGVLLAKQTILAEKLRAEPLLFFDATTHPLGSPGLRVTRP